MGIADEELVLVVAVEVVAAAMSVRRIDVRRPTPL